MGQAGRKAPRNRKACTALLMQWNSRWHTDLISCCTTPKGVVPVHTIQYIQTADIILLGENLGSYLDNPCIVQYVLPNSYYFGFRHETWTDQLIRTTGQARSACDIPKQERNLVQIQSGTSFWTVCSEVKLFGR